MSRPSLKTRLGPLTLETPLVAASGVFGFGEEFARLEGFDFGWLGAITLKGTTLKPRAGNPPPRAAEAPAGLINAIGLENPGVEKVVRDHLPRLKGLPCRIIANAAGGAVEEYVEVVRAFAAAGGVDAIELNFSCPNVRSGTALAQDPAALARALEKIRPATSLPLLVKLSPNVPDIRPAVRAALAGGADALTLVNTLPALVLDLRTRRPALGRGTGGLSGPAIKPVALLHVARAYAAARGAGPAILGMGGITNARDALEFVLAGAAAVGLGTWLLREPLCPGEILAGMAAFLEEQGLASLEDLRGKAEYPAEAGINDQ